MKFRLRNFVLSVFAFTLAILVSYCGNDRPASSARAPVKTDPWLGHYDSAKYVGMNTCRQCHNEIYQTFIKTGMGQSFDSVSRQKSVGRFEKHTVIYDKTSDFYYHPYWEGEKYYIKEFRLKDKDTVFSRTERVNFIIGSGQHTNSHIFNSNGYLHQMPMTFYSQKGTWDLPPGFENGSNTRFSRKIGLECMSCHNAYPVFVEGSENKYNSVMNGIDCERCHGPGSVHVALKQSGVRVDTSILADYSIVNPGKLPVDRQFDVCMRCHLQGNAILKPGKSFYDFKPGMVLSDYMSVFMPRYQGGEDEFIMASHAARLKMSQCFIQTANAKSSSRQATLRPYKEGLTCVTCHNPHVSVKVTGKEVFNKACTNCHQATKHTKECTASELSRKMMNDNCVGCHMPRSGSIDIPHVSVHDHYIRVPPKKTDVASVKKFLGLYAVNESHPSAAVKARAYINYYEKFNPQNLNLLDSALFYLNGTEGENELIRFSGLWALTQQKSKEWVLNTALKTKSWSNEDAWTAYRIGEACYHLGKKDEANEFYTRASALAPFNLDFESKLGINLLDLGKKEESAKVFDFILSQDAEYASAYNNRGRIYFYAGNFKQAAVFYSKALSLDPDLLSAMKNQVDLFNEQKQYDGAKEVLLKILSRHPGDKDAILLLQKMKQMKLIS
jgi:predicted negative regulator of RcsB-dependent stress response